MNIALFEKTVLNGLKYFGYFFLLFLVNRFLFLGVYANWTELRGFGAEIFQAFVVGARFDVSAICYAFLPIALFWLISLFVPKNKAAGFSGFYNAFSVVYLSIALLVYVSLLITDFFYFQFFQSHINILFFGIFNDDTQAVLHSVWKDYPIFKILLVYLTAFVGFWFVQRNVRSTNRHIEATTKSKVFGLVLLLVFPLFFIGMRGSLGVFTLRREHTNVSSNVFANSLCYNAIYALKFANSELKANRIDPDIDATLRKAGLTSVAEAQELYRKEVVNGFDSEFYSITNSNDFLAQNPPNVVFVLMESMSNHYFELNSETFNVLGDLKEELPYLYYFKNGLSSFNGTIFSLENLLVNTPKNIISQSSYFDTPFSSSVARPFKEQGYHTYFLTGASVSWRNVDNFIAHQGFDFIEGKSHIENKYPDAELFAWGAHDGYLFDYIEDKLKEPTKQAKFIFSLTISNHTPYEIPKNYTPYPISMDATMKKEIRVDEKMAYDNFYAHQYAASQLAKLIHNIRNSELGENTIIVATGDHNIRQVFEYSDETGFLKRSVPVLMYIPEKYKPAYFDPELFVSHKDIFPTLFNLSLSNQRYVYSGDDMFKKSSKYRFALNNYDFIADSLGAISIDNDKAYYYTWMDGSKKKLKNADVNSEHAQFMMQKMKRFEALQTVHIYQDILNHLSKK